MEKLILQIGAGEYLAQLRGGLIMSQGEIARLSDIGVDAGVLNTPAIDALVNAGNTDAARKRPSAPSAVPNISASKLSGVRAAQFKARNGAAGDAPRSCKARATSSLPVPVSP